MKQVWLIDTGASIEERFNGKINGIGDSTNDEAYIWEYKLNAKELQYMDNKTGYINLRYKDIRDNTGTGGTASAPAHPVAGIGMVHHQSTSSHGMMAPNPLPINNMTQINSGVSGGHHSALGMLEHPNN